MIECPICGIYWEYMKDNPVLDADPYLKSRYKVKEQTDCIKHVAFEHSTLILSECLENEIINLKEMVKKIGIRCK